MHRLFFIHQDYVADSVLTLRYDHYLQPEIKNTTIYYGTDNREQTLLNTFKQFEIITDKMSVVLDCDLVNPYCSPLNINIYQFGGWISQQLLKLIALDQCDSDQILIQDCDTFAIQKSTFFRNNLPVCAVVPTLTPKRYNEYYSQITQLDCNVDSCFVSEFMPVLKTDWINLRNRIEDIHQCHWLQALCNLFKQDVEKQVWFSEYQMLGLWAKNQHPNLETFIQNRLYLNKVEFNSLMFTNHNFACNGCFFSLSELETLLSNNCNE